MSKYCAVFAVVALTAKVAAFPGDYLSTYPNSGCYANPTLPPQMGGTNTYGGERAFLEFSPPMTRVDDCYEYTPGASYLVTLGSAGGKLSMVGSTLGTWSGGSQGTGGGCVRNSSISFNNLPWTGLKMNTDHTTYGDNYTATWTAPASGLAFVGGTRSSGFSSGTASVDVRVIGPGEECPIITQPPTQAAGSLNPNLCTGSEWAILAPIADGVLTCFRQIGGFLEIAIEAPTDQWVGLGFSKKNSGMQDIDIYIFDGLVAQNRFSTTTAEPPIDSSQPSYRDLVSRAVGPGATQGVIRRPLSPSGKRVDLSGSESYYVVTAVGPTQGQGQIGIHTAKGYSSSVIAADAVGSFGVNIATFATSKKQWHGTLMIFAWVFLCPTAIVDARAAKGVLGPLWFELHRLFQTLAVSLTIVGFILIKTDETVDITDQSFDSTQLHSKIGIAVVVLSIFQVFLGVARNFISKKTESNDAHPHGPRRWIFNYLHWATGFILVILSLMNVYSGIWLNCPDEPVANTPCDDGVGWVNRPVKKVFLAGVVFSAILYALVALLQIVMGNNKALIDTVGRHVLALASAMTLSSAITMGTIIFDSE